MISTSNSRPTLRDASNSAQQLCLLLGLQRRRIVGMVEAQALDAVLDRPLDQLRADVLREFEPQRARARQFDRPAEPGEAMPGEFEHRLAAVFLVEQHAVAGAAVGDPRRRLDRQHLEGIDALADRRRPCGARLLELRRDGRWPAPSAMGMSRRRVVAQWIWLMRLVLAQRPVRAAVLQEKLQLLEGRIFRRAEQARDGEGAAGIGPGRRTSPGSRRRASRAGSPT